MTEREQAIAIANRLLDEPNADPDDDQRILARQFLRALEPVSVDAALARVRQRYTSPSTAEVVATVLGMLDREPASRA